MEENIYAAPKAELGGPVEKVDVPGEIRTQIRYGVIAGIISASFTFVFTLIGMTGANVGGYSAWQFFDVIFLGAMAFGTYKGSRVCASILLIYYVGAKIFAYMQTGQIQGSLIALVMLYAYGKGLAGTIAYHRWKAAR